MKMSPSTTPKTGARYFGVPLCTTGVGRSVGRLEDVELGVYGYQFVIFEVLYEAPKRAVIVALAKPLGEGEASVALPVAVPPIY